MNRENKRINFSRLKHRLLEMGEIGGLPGGGVQRLALTDEDCMARDKFIEWLKECGARIEIDQIGNIFGLRGGLKEKAPVMVGSHLDTVKSAGIYDGALGVLVGLEILEVLEEHQIETSRPFAVVNFTNEEGVRFAPGMMGSKAFSGSTPLEDLLAVEAAEENKRVGDELRRIGFEGKMECGSFDVHSFLEIHIEQGPVLEQEDKDIGVVESVQGIFWTEYMIRGEAGHAGTTPMDMRKDAGYVAAKLSGFLRELTGGLGGVATLGFQEIMPNATNVIPDYARVRVDFRHPGLSQLKKGQERMDRFVEDTCRQEGVQFEKKELIRAEPVGFNSGIINLIEKTTDQLDYSHRRMASGAGHDAQMMASVCPSAMVFVPSRDGISHNINEFTEDRHIEAGANVMLNAVLKLLSD